MFITTKLRKLETTGHSTTERGPYLATPYGFSGLSSYRQIVRQAFLVGYYLYEIGYTTKWSHKTIHCDICTLFHQSKNETTTKT